MEGEKNRGRRGLSTPWMVRVGLMVNVSRQSGFAGFFAVQPVGLSQPKNDMRCVGEIDKKKRLATLPTSWFFLFFVALINTTKKY